MDTMLILIREPAGAEGAADAIGRTVCPYLETFGGTAAIANIRRYSEIRRGRERQRVTALGIALDGTRHADLTTIAGWLEGFLKPTAKQAKLDARFEIFLADDLDQVRCDHGVGARKTGSGNESE